MNINFENKRVLVTGACQGIGKEVALRLSKHKAKVVALSNNPENLAKLSEEDPEIVTVCVDLLDWNETRAAVESALPVDLLVNNAGVAIKEHCLAATPDVFDITFGTNVKAMLNVSQVVARSMIEREVAGSIVNLSSQACRAALQDHVVYCASKGAVDMLTKTMALELGVHNIRVNSVRPTIVMTDLGKRVWADSGRADEFRQKIPLGRFAEPHEVVDAIVFLLSDHSSMITGAGLPVDGGYLSV